MEKGKNHFVLIHGACHGAWCWYKVVTILKNLGHKVSVFDMAASGIHSKKIEEVNSMDEYNEPLTKFMENLSQDEDKVVLVGHSMGGLNISLAMEQFPKKIYVAVFVTAFMPGPNLNIPQISIQYNEQVDSQMDNKFAYNNGQEKNPTSLLFGPEFLATKLYQLSPAEDLTLATSLIRPVPLFEELDLLEKSKLTKENYGSVDRVYIVCNKDNVLNEEKIQKWLIKNNPPNDFEEIKDADHMVMFSKPSELCSCLVMITEKYCK